MYYNSIEWFQSNIFRNVLIVNSCLLGIICQETESLILKVLTLAKKIQIITYSTSICMHIQIFFCDLVKMINFHREYLVVEINHCIFVTHKNPAALTRNVILLGELKKNEKCNIKTGANFSKMRFFGLNKKLKLFHYQHDKNCMFKVVPDFSY